MKTILVVDDEAYFAETIKATIDSKNYTIITASDGEEGLKMIEEKHPDAVLLDINMPKMNGMEVLKALQDKKIKLPILITSNLSSRDTISEGIAMGIRGYIIKSNETAQTVVDSIEELFK